MALVGIVFLCVFRKLFFTGLDIVILASIFLRGLESCIQKSYFGKIVKYRFFNRSNFELKNSEMTYFHDSTACIGSVVPITLKLDSDYTQN